jgi:hypothetical protein
MLNTSQHFKMNKPTYALNSNFIGILTLHVSGSLSAHHQEFWAVHRLWYILCSCGDRMLLHAVLSYSGSIRSPQLHKMYQSRCTAQNSWWWAERLPETCRVVIPIKLEFSASVGLFTLICYNAQSCEYKKKKKKKKKTSQHICVLYNAYTPITLKRFLL